MALITGTTEHQLDLIKSYDLKNPYKVGVVKPGITVNSITTDPNTGRPISVNYTIGYINYNTLLNETSEVFVDDGKYDGGAFINPRTSETRKYPTTFSFIPSPLTETSYFIFKDDAEMGVVFEPKIEEEIFIERRKDNILEQHFRLSEIRTIVGLESYNNGYYNIINIE